MRQVLAYPDNITNTVKASNNEVFMVRFLGVGFYVGSGWLGEFTPFIAGTAISHLSRRMCKE